MTPEEQNERLMAPLRHPVVAPAARAYRAVTGVGLAVMVLAGILLAAALLTAFWSIPVAAVLAVPGLVAGYIGYRLYTVLT
ncbi:hypothetical protein [Kineococcus terrestris]|uniref:hypothetical protein n=1 Tax=Kineococcus terrestris TaxID=2044856 RepID=UPI0034DB28CB